MAAVTPVHSELDERHGYIPFWFKLEEDLELWMLALFFAGALILIAVGFFVLFLWDRQVWLSKPTILTCARMKPPSPRPLIFHPHGFIQPLFGCCESPSICFHSCLCPICRAFDTYVTTSVIPRKSAARYAIGAALCPCVFFICATPMLRARVRANLGGDGGRAHCLKDVLTHWCCCVFAIGQEARTADEAVNAETRFWCALNEYGSEKPIGYAIRLRAKTMEPPFVFVCE